MKSYSLNGDYLLSFADEQKNPSGREGMTVIPAKVPGNVEIDMMNAGLLPDVFFGNNVKDLKPYEFYRWIYDRDFDAPALLPGEKAFLHFEGVDCVADYTLNGVNIGHTENALIDHRLEVTDTLKEGANHLTVELHSPMLHAATCHNDAYEAAFYTNYESLRVRKSPAAYGWDIMPRTLSAGLWRGVSLEVEGENEIDELYIATRDASKDRAWMTCYVRTHTTAQYFLGLSLRLRGVAQNGAAFEHTQKLRFVHCRFDFEIKNPALWWPLGYGDPNVYDVTAELLLDGEVIASRQTSIGIRTAKLERTDVTLPGEGEFVFKINGEKILCKGSNWVPADALHSRDAERYEKILDLWTDTGSNILRCWGGNVYEDHAFYDYCDRHGIMVWQDFVMACAIYPIDDDFAAVMKEEAESVVKKLRNHPSIILWSGDNECDTFIQQLSGLSPEKNRTTRQIYPDVIHRLDPYRPYLPSSPYMPPKLYEYGNTFDVLSEYMPENHLWGPRDYFKSAFYTNAKCHFASETGYHGCNSLSSIRNFISEEKLWPWQDNDEWLTHAAEMTGPDGPYAYRIKLMADQIREMFGFDADNLEDFILASQISQAEAKKFFIELTRVKKWRRTGVIWWNMIDGWPQFSDAVVSYDFIKKLAYYYIKRSQQPVCLMMTEPESWHIHLMAGNDTFVPAQGTYRVWDADTDETVLEGHFEAPANGNAHVAALRVSNSDHRLFLIEWNVDGKRFFNHYMLGKPPFSFDRYKKWLRKIAELDGLFNADEIGK